MKLTKWLLPAAFAILAAVMVACGEASIPTSALPRTTDAGIAISMTEAVETLPIPGCRSVWHTRNEGPPPGACEETVLVRRYHADAGDGTLEAAVHGEPVRDDFYAMNLVAHSSEGNLTLVVVLPHSEAEEVRLVDADGNVVDRVGSTGSLAALAARSGTITVQAIRADGIVVAECPSGGVTIDGITYVCTLATSPPVTTTTTVAPAP